MVFQWGQDARARNESDGRSLSYWKRKPIPLAALAAARDEVIIDALCWGARSGLATDSSAATGRAAEISHAFCDRRLLPPPLLATLLPAPSERELARQSFASAFAFATTTRVDTWSCSLQLAAALIRCLIRSEAEASRAR